MQKKDIYYLDKVRISPYPEDTRPTSEQEQTRNYCYVSMNDNRLLLPGSLEYTAYDGLEIGGLASCSGFVLYLPDHKIPGIAHLAPHQDVYRVLVDWSLALKNLNIPITTNVYYLFQPGQTIVEKKRMEAYSLNSIGNSVSGIFPNSRSYPYDLISMSVYSGHLSSSIYVDKEGKISIVGDGKIY